MEKGRKIYLTKENWQKLDNLLVHYDKSEFIKFCLLNDIVEKGIDEVKKKLIIPFDN